MSLIAARKTMLAKTVAVYAHTHCEQRSQLSSEHPRWGLVRIKLAHTHRRGEIGAVN